MIRSIYLNYYSSNVAFLTYTLPAVEAAIASIANTLLELETTATFLINILKVHIPVNIALANTAYTFPASLLY